jgi:hypothetical protein
MTGLLYPNREKAVCQRVPPVLLAGKTAYTSRNLLHRRPEQKPEEHSPEPNWHYFETCCNFTGSS